MLRLIAWLFVFALGCFAQSLILDDRLISGLFLYEIAGILTFLLFYSYWDTPNKKKSMQSSFWDCNAWFMIAAIALVAGSNYLMWKAITSPQAHLYPYALYCWLGFLVLLLCSIGRPIWNKIKQTKRSEWVPLVLLLYAAFFLGIYRLTSIPYTVHGDEGMVGLYARKLLHGDVDTFFSTSWYSIPQFFYFVPSAGLFLFGDTLFGLRMSTVIVGVLCVIPFYALVRFLFGTQAAWIAGIALIANHWFIHLMHCGVNYVQASLFTISLLAVLFQANRTRSLSWALLGGGIMGIALMSYQANHILPILWIVSQIWLVMMRKISLRWFAGSTVFPLLVAALVVSPLLVHDFTRYGKTVAFESRAKDVMIFSEQSFHHMNGVYQAKGNAALVYRNQLQHALLAPIKYRDNSIQYDGRWPFLDPVIAVVFMLAAAVAVLRFYDERWFLPLLWLLAILIAGGALTVDTPFFPRLAGTTTLYFVLVAGMISVLWKNASTSVSRWITGIVVLAIVLCSSYLNLKHYFGEYANEISPRSIHSVQTQIGRYLQGRCDKSKVYVFPGPNTMFNSGTVLFLTGDCQGFDVQNLPNLASGEPVTVVIDVSQQSRLAEMEAKIPDGIVTEHKTVDGRTAFWSIVRN